MGRHASNVLVYGKFVVFQMMLSRIKFASSNMKIFLFFPQKNYPHLKITQHTVERFFMSYVTASLEFCLKKQFP